MSEYLSARCKELGIKNLLVSYCDFQGVSRSKLVPVHKIDSVSKNGAGFAGHASYLDLTPADEDVLAYPVEQSLVQLPWNKEVGWLPSDLFLGSQRLDNSPRSCLNRVRSMVSDLDYQVKTGVECEFFLLDKEALTQSDPHDLLDKPCYDQKAIMRRYELISLISEYMYQMGWEPYQSDHEDANGQFEMNWEYDESMVTADRHTFFKFMVQMLAEEHGFRATFMPKPFSNLTGNGCHVHVSMWDSTGKKNLFETQDKQGLSALGLSFMAGVLKKASSLSVLTNPVVNSYKRLNAAGTTSGATWCSNQVTFGGNDRTKLIRVPDTDRFEFRGPDGLANPYLLQAGIIAAGLIGVSANLQLEDEMFPGQLPSNLDSAINALQADRELSEYLGGDLIQAYTKLKYEEWHSYLHNVSDWEIKKYLTL